MAPLDESPRDIAGYDPTRDADGFRWDAVRASRVLEFFGKQLKLTSGRLAGKPFELPAWQRDYVATLHGWVDDAGMRRYRESLFFVPRKAGKGLSLDTAIPTPTGWTTMGEVAVGDLLLDDNGLPCVVTFTSEEHLIDCYLLKFSNGQEVIADGEHRWVTSARIDRPGSGVGSRNRTEGMTRIRTTREIAESVHCGGRGDRNHSLQLCQPLSLDALMLPLDPYVLGAWLGDGSSRNPALSCGDQDLDHMTAQLQLAGLSTRAVRERTAWRVSFSADVPRTHERNLYKTLRRMNLLDNKHIPSEYLRASFRQRLTLLQGLMDTDGCISKDGLELSFDTTSPRLRDGVAELLATMGIKYSVKTRPMRCNRRAVSGCSYRIQFHAFRDEVSVFRLPRKLERMRRRTDKAARSKTVQIVSCEMVESVPTKCIQVDSPSRMFLFGRSMLPTHNTETAAGLALVGLLLDREAKPEVYSAAKTRDQATRVFEPSAIMVRNNPALAGMLKVTDGIKRISCARNNGYYQAIAADADVAHGKNPHTVLFDELHTQPNRRLYDGLKTGMGARTQPLFVSLTTAGHDRHSICWEVWNHARLVRDGVIRDARFLPLLYQMEDGDSWEDEEVWRRVNPNIGTTVTMEFLRHEFQRARTTPALENTFRNLYLNQWTEQAVRWIGMDAWDACKSGFDELDGAWCMAGLDLSSTRDLTALSLVFPVDDRIVLRTKYWVPQDSAREREERDRVPYRQWIDEGWITATPGASVDYDVIKHEIMRLAERYEIKAIAIDRWNANQLAKQIEDQGFNVGFFGQGYASMSSPSKELERLIVDKQLAHDGNPVTRWMACNASVEQDAAGNIKPSKKTSTERIDGIVATVMALGVLAQQSAPVWAETEIGM